MADPVFDLESVIKRRGFIWPSFEIYGGSSGFYDYGPLGTAMRNNILKVWRKYFVQREGFAEIDTPALTPQEVFLASGHLDKFNDLILECSKCPVLYKAENLISEHHPEISTQLTVDALTADELDALVRDNGITCPDCNSYLRDSYEFNLMFRTTVGRDKVVYLHPETAQGIFVNFQKLYNYFRERLPFGVVTVGKGFRNEISPRQGLIRLREFNIAEAEVFVDPDSDEFRGFDKVKETEFVLLDQHGAFHKLTAAEAVKDEIICHQALAYYMVITQNFLTEIGINPEKLRFRQHQKDEMAHYADDCWDAEIQMEINTRENWIECVGIANRSCFDLEQHMKATGQDLRAFNRFDEPVEQKFIRLKPNLPLIGRMFKKDAVAVKAHLESLTSPFPEKITMELNGENLEINGSMFTIEETIEKVSGKKYIPAVIEPSFGIGRILYAVLQHSYHVGKSREGVDSESYNMLKLNPVIAPIHIAVFPLFNRTGMKEMADRILQDLIKLGLTATLDDSGSIGKRYARMDEIGTPYCITVDHKSLEDNTVTIRNRDSTEQTRIHEHGLPQNVSKLLSGELSFEQLAEFEDS